MLAVLSSLVFDPDGVVALDVAPDSLLAEARRRMNRVATLDGGAVVNDFGYSEADRAFALRWPVVSAAQEALVQRLAAWYGQLRLACPQGLFVVAVEAYRPGLVESELSLLVLEKLA